MMDPWKDKRKYMKDVLIGGAADGASAAVRLLRRENELVPECWQGE